VTCGTPRTAVAGSRTVDGVVGGTERDADAETGSARDAEPAGDENGLPERAADRLAEPETWAEPPPEVLEGLLARIREERARRDAPGGDTGGAG
jgi:hypothetical protein